MKKFVLLIKSQSPIPPGSHWITINGGDGGGQAVLIQPQPDGSAKVIGGAGGALNHLRLRSVKSKDTYKEEAAAKAVDKRAAKKEQTKADKAAGIHQEKQDALKNLKKQKQEAERGVIDSVAKKAGWKQEEMDFPDADYEHLSAAALEKVKARHHAKLLSRAKDVIKQSREKLLNDPKSRSDLGIGEIPLNSVGHEDLSVADLMPVPKQQGGLGFNPDYKGRSEASGLSREQLVEEAHIVKQGKLAELTPEQKMAMFERGQAADLIKKELEGIKEPAAPLADASLLSAKDALDLVKDGKRLADIDSQIRAAAAEINKSTSEPKAFVLESSDDADIDEKSKETIINDLRTAQTAAFLSEVGAIAGANPEETLGGHIGVGAYNSINSLALAVGGDALVDRSVVDVLGIAGAAQVLARRIHSDMTATEVGHIADGMQDWHVNHYMKTSTDALKKSKALTEAAKEIDLSGYTDSGDDLAVAQELNARRRACIGDAQRILGQSLGEMEANAALVMAMKQGKPNSVQVSLGSTTPENAIKQVRALGLMPGDYDLEKVGKDTFLTVNGDGMDKLASPISRDDLQQIKRNIAIVRGDHDEDGWLPLGVANRPDLVMDVKAGVADQLAKPFVAKSDLKKSLMDYIGGRAADGDHAADILADVQSAGFFENVGADRSDEYRDALDEIAPLKDKNGKQQRAEALADLFDGYANDYVKGLGGKRTTLNKQSFAVDQKSVDALHRALAETPEGTAAYKQIGELTNSDQRAIREFFHRHVAKESPEAGQMRADLDAHTANEPERTSMDMFGDESDNPEWKSWSSKRDELATKLNASSITWGKYIETMGSNAKAYESVQDMIRSKVASTFVDAHNKMNAGSPLKLGRTVIRNNLDHLASVDPEASAARLAKNKELIDSLRERSGGKYAAGSVSDKISAAQEEKAAYEQAQMGFFSSDDAPVSSSGEPAPIGSDERHTLGHEAERQLAGMMGVVGQNFKAGQPTKLWNVSMSGKYAPQQRAIKLVAANKRVVLAAGAGCVRGDTILDDADGLNVTFYDWWITGNRPLVNSVSANGEIEIVRASPVFIKGFSKMLEVKTTSASIVVSENHLFLTGRGWVFAKDLLSTDFLLNRSFCDMSANRNPSDVVGVPISLKKAQYCLGRYWTGSRQCDVPLPPSEGICLASSQEPIDAEGNIHQNIHEDDQHFFALYNQEVLCKSLPSMRDFYNQFALLNTPSIENQNFADSFLLPAHHTEAEQLFQKLSSAVLQKAHKECLYFGRDDLVDRLSNLDMLAQYPEHEGSDELFSGTSGAIQQPLPQDRVHYISEEPILTSQVSAYSLIFTPILSVEEKGYFITFDLHVPVNNNYFANGILHHNSGKTNMMLGAHAHLSGLGKVKRSIFICPSIVQGQFGGEALRLLEAGKFKAHIQPGASQADRIAAYKDPSTHICVMTHQSFRDDMIHLAAGHAGVPEADMVAKIGAMSPIERKAWAAETMKKEGIDFDASFVDEAHDTLNRAGKENSSLSNVVEAVGHNTPYHVYASGDPIKNDASEIHSMLQKMDPDRYADRAAFMRRYGADTVASKDALKREMARYMFPTSITPDVQRDRKEVRVELSEGQKSALKELNKHLGDARMAHRRGSANVEACRAISPNSFAGVPEAEHEAIAKKLQGSIGILKSSAINRIINSHPDNAKVRAAVQIVKDRAGKQGVIFARNKASVEQYKAALEKEGKRVVVITGSDSAKDKDKKRRLFNPESGDAQADVLIASDAGAVGMNLQSGQYLIQHDVSQTAKTHSQRSARIDRIGQKNGIELIDLVANHAEEKRSRDRLMKKYDLKNMMADPMDGLDDSGVAGAISARMNAAQSQDSLF